MTQETVVVAAERRDGGDRIALNLGLAANTGLAILKTAVGIIGHSPALLADGVNSTSDVAYYVVVAVFMRLAARPADEDHPYGHRQMESIAALIVGAFVITTAIAIFWDAVNNVFDYVVGQSERVAAAPIALWVALLTVGLKVVLTLVTRRIGQRGSNAAILALAYDHRNDVFSAAGAAVGITLARLGYLWVDPLAGALVALIILRTGIEILRESSSDLMDTVPSAALDRQVRQALAGVVGVLRVDEIQAHRFGPYLVVNVTITVDGRLSVAEADLVADQVQRALMSSIRLLRRVHVQYRPDSLRHSVRLSPRP
ncbi:MAG: cation diffusion facilitator family transporter [Anaerolineae bacterium]